MSPAPSGGLQVERYIGSCLISAPPYSKRYPFRPAEYGHYGGGPQPATAQRPPQPAPAWAGLPLIAMNPPSPRRTKKTSGKDKEERSPLSRLAVHTQGAPLIQAGRQNRNNRGQQHKQQQPQQRARQQNDKTQVSAKEGSDNLSVASDESSANSENSLPRIIKPRKRRKKDRKPQQAQNQASNSAPAQPNQEPRRDSPQSSIVTLKPYTPLCKDNLHPAPDDLPGEPGLKCQCRYCDPVSVVWDVEAGCYSPFLTPPPAAGPSSSSPSSSPARPQPSLPPSEPEPDPEWSSALEVSSEIVTSPNGHRDIEIRFFSATAPPLAPSPPPPRSPVSPPWDHRFAL